MYHLRRLSALVLSLAIAPLLFLPTPAAAANEDSMPLVLSSASALLMEKETGTVLLQQNAHQKLEPASVTKIMTLLLVMEAVDSGRLTPAWDIALMSRELILRHPDIQQYTTIWTDSIRNGAFGLTNTNRLVRFYDGATGLKTGFTASAQYCMSATAQRNGMELIAVVMKAPTTAQRFQDASSLLDYGFANYALITPQPESPLAPVDVLLGRSKTVQPQLQRECHLLVEKTQADQVTTRVDLAQDVQAPVDPGQTLGEFQVYVGNELRDSVPIVAAQGVDRLSVPGLFSQLLRRLLFAG